MNYMKKAWMLVLNTYTCIKIRMVLAVLIIKFARYYIVQQKNLRKKFFLSLSD
jgi:hypothetical protein